MELYIYNNRGMESAKPTELLVSHAINFSAAAYGSGDFQFAIFSSEKESDKDSIIVTRTMQSKS